MTISKLTTLAIGVALLAGCSAAQVTKVHQDTLTCIDNVRNLHAPVGEYEAKYHFGPTHPTLAERLEPSNSKLTEEEKKIFTAYWTEQEVCKDAIVNGFTKIGKHVRAGITLKYWNTVNDVRASVLMDNITIQEASQAFHTLRNGWSDQMNAIAQVEQQKADEGWAAFAKGMQEKRAAQRANMPTQTSCTGHGNTVNCTTY